MARRKKPPPSTPTTIYLETESKGNGRLGPWQKRGKLKRIIIMKRWRRRENSLHLFWSNHVITLHLLMETWSASPKKSEEGWQNNSIWPPVSLHGFPVFRRRWTFPCSTSQSTVNMRQMKFPFYRETWLFMLHFLLFLWIHFCSP